MSAYISVSAAIACIALAGCATGAASPQAQAVNVVASDFCRTMKSVLPPTGKPSWSIDDTPETRTDARRIARAVDARCGKSVEMN